MRAALCAIRIGSPGDAGDGARVRKPRCSSPIRRYLSDFTPPLAPPHQGEGNRACRVAGVALIISAVATWGQPASACIVPEGFARIATAEAEIAYRWEPEHLEVGQFFAAEVIACRAPGPVAVSGVVLDAQMPAHGHGMNYRPTATQVGPDRFRITGLMLHMAGKWRLTFDLVHADRRTRLSRDLDLKP